MLAKEKFESLNWENGHEIIRKNIFYQLCFWIIEKIYEPKSFLFRFDWVRIMAQNGYFNVPINRQTLEWRALLKKYLQFT